MKKLITILLTLSIFGWCGAYNIQSTQTHRDVERIFLQENNVSYPKMIDKCTYPLRMIARGFGHMESNMCTKGASRHNNNCRSLHPHGSKQYRHQANTWGWRYRGGEPLNTYGRATASLYDFMATYYYSYGCTVDLAHIHYYIYGGADCGRGHSRQYLKTLKQYIFNL